MDPNSKEKGVSRYLHILPQCRVHAYSTARRVDGEHLRSPEVPKLQTLFGLQFG